MKRVLLTGINGTVAQVMKKELGTKYDISGLSIPRMDGLLAEGRSTWKELLDAYRDRVSAELTAACSGGDAVVHLGWNTTDEQLLPHVIDGRGHVWQWVSMTRTRANTAAFKRAFAAFNPRCCGC